MKRRRYLSVGQKTFNDEGGEEWFSAAGGLELLQA